VPQDFRLLVFAAGIIDTGGNLPTVSTTLVKRVANFASGVVVTGGKVVHP
jgi:hypothetical protein